MMSSTPTPRRLSQTNWLWTVLFSIALMNASTVAIAMHPKARHQEKQQIDALEEQWKAAEISGDVAAIERLMADDFIGISIDGEANTKTQELDRFHHHKLSFTRIDLSDRKIKLLGSVAIVTSRAEVEGMNDCELLRGTYRYTRVYQRLATGVWKTTNFEVTSVPNKHVKH